MRLSEAIDQADLFRPNVILAEQKKMWLYQLESELAEMMGTDLSSWSEDDPELLLDSPQDGIYALYLAPFIDWALEETDRYQMDTVMSNQALAGVKAWIRRNNWHPRAGIEKFSGVFQ